MIEHEIRKIKIDDIHLDKYNPRYKTYSEDEKSDILKFIINVSSDNKILGLLSDILSQDSLNPLNTPGIIKENDKWVVIDGNRRVSCIKLLLAGNSYWDKINNNEVKKYLSKNRDLVLKFIYSFKRKNKNKINFIILKNRKEAKIWMERVHTQLGGYTTQTWKTFERYLSQDNIIALKIYEKMNEYNIPRHQYVELIDFSIWDRIFTLNIFRDFFGIEKKNKVIIINDNEFQKKVNAMINLLELKIEDSNRIIYSNDFINITQAKETIKKIEKKLIQIHNKNNYKQIESLVEIKMKSSSNVIQNIKNSKHTSKKIQKILLFEKCIPHISNEKIINVLNQIQYLNKNKNKNKEIISFCIRPLIDISTTQFLRDGLKKSENWLNDKNLKDRILYAISELIKIGVDGNNKTTLNHIKYRIDEFILATNGDLHDVSFISTTKELDDNLKRVAIFLEEIWKNIN